MHPFGLSKVRAFRVIGLLCLSVLTLTLAVAVFSVLGVSAQTQASPQKVTAIYDGDMTWDPECAAIQHKFTVEVWNVGSAGGGNYGDGTIISEGPDCNVDSKGNASPGQYRTTTLHGTFSGGPNGEMIIIDPAQPQLDERVLFIDGKIARITISDGVNSFHIDCQVTNSQAFQGITPIPATVAPVVQTPATNPPPAGNPPSAGNEPTSQSSPDLSGLLGALGVAAGVIGAILAVAGLVAILVSARNKGNQPPPKPKSTKPAEPEPPIFHYVLNANVGSVEVRLNEPAPVYFQVLRVSPDGPAEVAPEAVIQVIVPETPGGVAGWPTTGMGSLECTFSIPTPKVCELLTVLAIASIGDVVKARTYVQVRILPVYELELKWEDPQPQPLLVDGKEARAWAKVTAIPPDPETPLDMLAKQVDVRVQGPNSNWISQPLRPYIEFEKQWNPVSVVRPGMGIELQPGNPELVANFSAGRQQLVARLSIELKQEVTLGVWVNGKKEADAVYLRKQAPPGWDFAEIVTFFHAPDNESKPCQPSFSYGFDTPPIEAEPPILEVKDFGESTVVKGQYVIRVALIDGTDLETCFGEMPANQRKVKVKVSARDDQGREYQDYVTYLLRPMVSFCVQAFVASPSVHKAQHEYRSIQFNEEMGLVTNGDDCLRLAGYFMRTDLLASSGPDPEQRLDIGEVSGFVWRNPQDEADFGEPQKVDFGELQSDSAESQAGFVCFAIRSGQPLEVTPARLNAPHSLIIKPALRPDVGAGYTLDADVLEVKIAVEFLRLRLWAVPGLRRHTSEAVAYLDLLPSHKPLSGQQVTLSIEAPSSMILEPDGYEIQQDTYAQGTKSLCGPGAVFWLLRYSGITWDAMPGASFTVRAGLEDPPESRWQAEKSIRVFENLVVMLNDLAQDSELAKQINNPDREDLLPVLELPPSPDMRPWDTPENIDANLKAARKLLNYTRAWPYAVTSLPRQIREYCYGPVYNIQSWFGGGNTFVCSQMRDHLISWLEQRRFKQAHESAQDAIRRLEKMNGLDFGHYALVPFHVWAGIFPAGTDRFSEYRALDPWWSQQWPDEWRQPENLLTQMNENVRLNVFKLANASLVTLLVDLSPAMSVYDAFQAFRAWLNGEPPEKIREMLGASTFGDWYSLLRCDSDNVDAEGKYLVGMGKDLEHWFQALIKDLG